jgi:hypothetical protein
MGGLQVRAVLVKTVHAEPVEDRISGLGAARIPQTGFEAPAKQVELNRMNSSSYNCAGLNPL